MNKELKGLLEALRDAYESQQFWIEAEEALDTQDREGGNPVSHELATKVSDSLMDAYANTDEAGWALGEFLQDFEEIQ